MSSSSNKRIAKNTALFYFRMLITMLVSLYTSRIVLNVLGVENYGIYNVVGGVVVLFSFLNNAMSVSTSRFLTVELGRKEYDKLNKTFSAALSIHIGIAILVFILAETIGLWFVLNKLVIPDDRMNAAIWVYQFSILSSMVGLTQVPYNATIIAHEKMDVYAYVSILDVSLKLIIVFAITWIAGIDKLILYSILIFMVSLTTAMTYRIYSKRKYAECTYRWNWDKSLYKKMINFSGWSLLSSFAWVMVNQGSSILINLFFGPAMSAAQAIAIQVNAAISNFVTNFRTAVNPQIIKLYANNEKEKMFTLVFQSSVYSYFILLFLILPVFLETDFILSIWLKKPPENAVLFVKLILIFTLIQTFDAAFVIVLQAVGRIKENALLGATLGLLFLLPTTYILFKFGFQAQALYYIMILNAFILSFGVKPYLLYKIAGMNVKDYLKKVVVPVIKVTPAAILLPFLIAFYMHEGILRFFILGMVSVLSVSLSVFYIGMDKILRKKIINTIKLKITIFSNRLNNDKTN